MVQMGGSFYNRTGAHQKVLRVRFSIFWNGIFVDKSKRKDVLKVDVRHMFGS